MPTKMNHAIRQRIIAAARRSFEREGELEIDDSDFPEQTEELISSVDDTLEGMIENGGCYVKAWVWTAFDDDDLELLKGN